MGWTRGLNGLTTCSLSQSPWLGYEYWDRAMCHANYAIQSWPTTGNEGGRSPNEAWDTHMSGKEGPHRMPKHLVRWGKAGYVYDDSAGFRPTGIKGYCIGYSYMHAKGCYDMLMCDTHRVKQTQNVCFVTSPDSVLNPESAPIEVPLVFKTTRLKSTRLLRGSKRRWAKFMTMPMMDFPQTTPS